MLKALKRIKPSVSNKDLKDYKDWTEEYGVDGSYV